MTPGRRSSPSALVSPASARSLRSAACSSDADRDTQPQGARLQSQPRYAHCPGGADASDRCHRDRDPALHRSLHRARGLDRAPDRAPDRIRPRAGRFRLALASLVFPHEKRPAGRPLTVGEGRAPHALDHVTAPRSGMNKTAEHRSSGRYATLPNSIGLYPTGLP
jgi:hypothetical protein